MSRTFWKALAWSSATTSACDCKGLRAESMRPSFTPNSQMHSLSANRWLILQATSQHVRSHGANGQLGDHHALGCPCFATVRVATQAWHGCLPKDFERHLLCQGHRASSQQCSMLDINFARLLCMHSCLSVTVPMTEQLHVLLYAAAMQYETYGSHSSAMFRASVAYAMHGEILTMHTINTVYSPAAVRNSDSVSPMG